MSCGDRVQLAGEVAVARFVEVGVDPCLERREPGLFEARCLGLRERLEGDVCERLPARARALHAGRQWRRAA